MTQQKRDICAIALTQYMTKFPKVLVFRQNQRERLNIEIIYNQNNKKRLWVQLFIKLIF